MINIYKKIISNYIDNTLTTNIIKDFALKNNINISNSESIIIYNFIKENYEFILNGNEEKIYKLKGLISTDLYNKIIELYYQYKDKLKKA